MKTYVFALILILTSCKEKPSGELGQNAPLEAQSVVTLRILGTVQDGGSPHIGCKKSCCADLFNNPDSDRKVVSLGIVDHENNKSYLFEATPDITSQMKLLKELSGRTDETPSGIFMTHAHIGHYTGLMYLGREALGAKQVPVYAMPKMKTFLESNGPWDQLVALNNIEIHPLQNEKPITLTKNIVVTPFIVPHRDEYSETVGFKIEGPEKSILFIPDIDKWSRWERDIVTEIKNVDLAFLDATFFDGDEINTRNISEIPHPFVVESMDLFQSLPDKERSKIHFIHFNHTNALLIKDSDQQKMALDKGFNIAAFNQEFAL
ncbi:MBL fold metallo-hydrolase [Flagellimonas aequoris]|uniref:MBL fold metallo-hydrolase n=1 Tax=Flagellimonas aequoris TaxID=2306997 RepID=A0A418N9J0_9FLAO|nr:MBL fold metallo-hydrolase [Allomuricauda aequoris]RIV72162.1 MBL fold metallo-hydrolase [Allomuricauda aequoris]TXK03934.1 MBL fold metallo-hydrolase [Allomuricauda aequoris]